VVDWTSDETGKGSEGSSKADLITKTLYCPAAEAGYKTLGADKKPPQSLERLVPKRSPSPGLVCTIYGADAGILQVFMQMWCGYRILKRYGCIL